MARLFSHRGEPVTSFERDLVASCSDARSPFFGLARRIGVDALVIVLDEFASEKVHIPTREFFFAALYRVQRDADIVRRLADGETVDQVASLHGVHRNTIRNVARHTDRAAHVRAKG